MKIFRATMVFLLVTIFAAGSLAFAAKTVTLNALFMKQAGYSEDDTKAGTTEFEKQNPNVKVQLTFVAYEELEQKIITSAQSGSYDVVLSDGPFTAKFAEAKIVRPVTIAASDKKDIFPAVLAGTQYNGKYWGMPWLNDCRYLFYNKTMLNKAGIKTPPKTMDELLADAKLLKDKGVVQYPIVWTWAQAECLMCDFTPLTVIFGGGLTDRKNKPTIDSPGNKKALDFMVNSVKNGLSNPHSVEFTESEAQNTFCSGNAAFTFLWTSTYAAAQDPTQSKLAKDEVGIAVIPGQGKVVSATCNGGQPLAVSAGSKHPREAAQYIKYLCGKYFQKKYCTNALPIWKSLFDDPQVVASSPEVVKAAKVQYNYFVSRPMVPYWGELASFMEVKIQEALLGKTTSDAALKECQAKARELAGKK